MGHLFFYLREHGLKKRRLSTLRFAFLVLLAAGLGILAWGLWPIAQSTHVLKITPEQMRVPGDDSAAVLETRRFSLLTPTGVRLGDTAEARLTFETLPGNGASSGTANARDNYAVFVETRLDFPGFMVDPPGISGQILPPGRTVVFWWRLTSAQTGSYSGTAWLSLRFESLTGGEDRVQALAAPRLQVQVRSLLGLSGQVSRWVGSLLALAGVSGFLWRWKSA